MSKVHENTERQEKLKNEKIQNSIKHVFTDRSIDKVEENKVLIDFKSKKYNERKQKYDKIKQKQRNLSEIKFPFIE